MAHNYNNNSSGEGCLTAIMMFILFFGNIALFTGKINDLPILSFLAIIEDVLIIGVIINMFTDKSPKSNNEVVPRQTTVNQKSIEKPEEPLPVKNNISITPHDNDKNKITLLNSRYSVPDTSPIIATVDSLQSEMEAYQCIAILQTVNIVVSKRNECIKQLINIKIEIDNILSCSICTTDSEQIKYICDHKDFLQQKKDEYLAKQQQINENFVLLISKESYAFAQLIEVLSEISKSKKILGGNGVPFKSFVKINSTIPGDFFRSILSSVELDFNAYRFFLLPDVILVFNKSNSFITALEPMALTITFKNQQKNVYAYTRGKESWTYSDSLIADDSELISKGYTRTRWLHEKKAGGPDLRYSNNQMYQSRMDTYGYTDITIQIGQYRADYSMSKGNPSNRLGKMVKGYCSIIHEMNTIPSLLRLLENTAKNTKNAECLSQEYESICTNIICKIG